MKKSLFFLFIVLNIFFINNIKVKAWVCQYKSTASYGCGNFELTIDDATGNINSIKYSKDNVTTNYFKFVDNSSWFIYKNDVINDQLCPGASFRIDKYSSDDKPVCDIILSYDGDIIPSGTAEEPYEFQYGENPKYPDDPKPGIDPNEEVKYTVITRSGFNYEEPAFCDIFESASDEDKNNIVGLATVTDGTKKFRACVASSSAAREKMMPACGDNGNPARLNGKDKDGNAIYVWSCEKEELISSEKLFKVVLSDSKNYFPPATCEGEGFGFLDYQVVTNGSSSVEACVSYDIEPKITCSQGDTIELKGSDSEGKAIHAYLCYTNKFNGNIGADPNLKTDNDCESYLGNPEYNPNVNTQSPAYYLQFAFNIMKYAAMVLLLIFTIVEFVKASSSSNQDAMKKAIQNTIKRLILAIIIFFLPILIKFLLTVLGAYSPGTCGIS